MAIALDATSSFTDGGPVQDPYTSGSFTPPVDSWVFVCASSFATSGDDNSFINVTGTFYTWSRVANAFLDQLNFGAACAPPPIAFWMTKATAGIAITVSQECVDGLGFSHVQGIWVLTGAHATTPVIDADTFTSPTAAASITMTATAAGQWALFGMIDWDNSTDVPAESDVNMTTRKAGFTAGEVQAHFLGDLVSTGAGGITVGTNVLSAPQGTNAVAVLIQAADESVSGVLDVSVPVPVVALDGEVTAAGVLDASIPVFAADFAGELSSSGVLDISVPVFSADFAGELTASGVLDVVLPVPAAAFDGELSTAGTLGADLPVPTVALDGELNVQGQLDLVLPVPDVSLTGELPVSGQLSAEIPVFSVDFTGNSAAGGATMGPCGWTIPDPLCSDTWAGTSAEIKAAARDYAALILWGATGREFGLCEITVRPCGWRRCGDNLWDFFGWSWGSGTWTPYIWQGTWYNCACPGICCCDPRCQISLQGDVDSIIEVLIDGIAVDPDTYRVDDKHWLVRNSPDCWPECPDMDSAEPVLQVTYMRGNPVPAALLRAASILADEWARACQGLDCRLSNKVTSIARNGIQIDMNNPESMLDDGMTGIWEVDSVINAINPHKRKQRGRVYAPELKVPRMTTWP